MNAVMAKKAVTLDVVEQAGHPDTEDYYASYSSYLTVLRAWFVAYGIGGPVLFLTQERISKAIAGSGYARAVVYLFISGVALQILIALINKWANWFMFGLSDSTRRRRHVFCAFVHWLTRQFWIDVVCDIGSVVCFGWATVKVLLIFA
jgi:hypothetical protein